MNPENLNLFIMIFCICFIILTLHKNNPKILLRLILRLKRKVYQFKSMFFYRIDNIVSFIKSLIEKIKKMLKESSKNTKEKLKKYLPKAKAKAKVPSHNKTDSWTYYLLRWHLYLEKGLDVKDKRILDLYLKRYKDEFENYKFFALILLILFILTITVSFIKYIIKTRI